MATCVVVDDHASFRQATSDLLSAAGVDVVARASDVAEALAAIEAHRPDLLLLDVLLGDDTALSVLERLPAAAAIRVLLTSSRLESEQPPEILRHPFVTKSELTVELLRAWAEGPGS